MKSFVKTILALSAICLISGCTGYGVTFQSAPSDQLTSCHPALVGNWRMVEGARNDKPTGTQEFLSVNADCSTIVSVTVKNEGGKQEIKSDNLKTDKDYQIQFADLGDEQQYVVVTPKETTFRMSDGVEGSKENLVLPSGKIIYRINKGKDGVILQSVDLDKTAQLVLQNKIDGQLYVDQGENSPKKAANIYIRSDVKKTAIYLSTLDIYSDKRMLMVPTNPQERKLIQKAIKNLGKDKKTK